MILPDEQTKHGIGQVSTLEMRRMESLDEVVRWQRKVQRIVMENSPHRIPAIFHMEGLCGAFIQDSTSFPSGIGRGAGWNPKLEEKIAEIVSRQEAACGITHVFAPVLDGREKRMERIRFLQPAWDQLIQKGARNMRQQDAEQKV